MAKKKSSGTDLGFSLLVGAIRFGIAWAGRFLSSVGETVQGVYQDIPAYNTRFDSWCMANFGTQMHILFKLVLFCIFGFLLSPFILFWIFLKSF